MSLTNSSIWFSSGAGGGSFYPYTIDQSLLGNEADSPYLNRTPSSASNRRTYTISAWIKPALEVATFSILGAGSSGSAYYIFGIEGDDLYFEETSGGGFLRADRKLRDPSAWYHLVASVDSTQATASDRIKLYVNGVRETAFTSESYMSQNFQSAYINNTSVHYIGHSPAQGSHYLNGYIAEINFIDGQALDPTSFGADLNGVWIPQAFAGSYGTNGFYLPFEVTAGDGVYLDGVGDNIRWTDATQYDIGTSDDFCLEFFTKGDFENNYSYAMGDYAVAGPHFMLQLGSGGNIYGYYGNGLANNFDATAYMTTTDWHHIAYVRESGTYRFYIDGVQRHTGIAGSTVAFDVSQFNIGDAYPAAGAPHFNGYLSNLRFTIGSARYPSGTTFTVPTTTLTNDSSDVKLLAFTTSTITADGSTAAIAGSVTEGNPTYTEDNPFSNTIGTDASGNSNNFTSNNLDFSDVLLDSTTNNFATLNPLDNYNTGATLSEGNLKWTIGAADGASRSTYVMTAGKWYVEFLSNNDYIGVVSGNANITDVNGTQTVFYVQDGTKKVNGTFSSYGVSYSSGDIIGIALDLDASPQTVTFYKNNSSQGSLNLTDVGNEGYSVSCGSGSGSTNATANFGQDSTFAGATTAGGNSDANGVGDFKYAPPAGYLALCTSNLPDVALGPDVNTSDERANENFVPYLYTADNTSPKSRTGMGFTPDWLWFKCRTIGFSNGLYDTVRGIPYQLQTNTAGPENSYTLLDSFDADGFTTGTDATAGTVLNYGTDTYVTWSWKAGGTPTATNTAGVGAVPTSGSVLIDGVASTSALAGTIAANKITANTAAGLSIINYTGNGLSGQTVAHALSSTPDFIIHKDRGTNSNNNQWNVWHRYAGDGDDYGYLSTTAAFTGDAQIIPNGTDTIELKANLTTSNESGHSFIMYAFHSVDGFSKAGSYNGNGDADGAFVHTGFRPAFVLLKKSSAAGDNWSIYDTGRDPYNVATKYLIPNSSQTEGSTTSLDFVSNGFKIRASGSWINTASATYIYMAFAENPFKYANAR